VYLTQSQRAFIKEHCSNILKEQLCLVKSRPLNAKVMSVVKVRHRDYTYSPTETIIEKLVGIKGVLCRSIEIDWQQSQSSVYVLPFDGYDWRPTVFERNDPVANALGSLLLEQVITDRFSQITNIHQVIEKKIPIHVFGVNKYVAIRTAAYPKFSQLLDELL
jgi:hypothetical protein